MGRQSTVRTPFPPARACTRAYDARVRTGARRNVHEDAPRTQRSGGRSILRVHEFQDAIRLSRSRRSRLVSGGPWFSGPS